MLDYISQYLKLHYPINEKNLNPEDNFSRMKQQILINQRKRRRRRRINSQSSDHEESDEESSFTDDDLSDLSEGFYFLF